VVAVCRTAALLPLLFRVDISMTDARRFFCALGHISCPRPLQPGIGRSSTGTRRLLASREEY